MKTYRPHRIAGCALIALTLAVTGCSAGASTAKGDGAGGDQPTTLRIGALGNTTDSLNPLTTNGFADYIAIAHLYDPLVENRDGEPVLRLAETIEPDAGATRWTITLKKGATFSDGKPVTASDVAYSLRLIADPKQSPNYAQFYADLDAANIEVVDDRTLEVPFTRPRGDFVTTILSFSSNVFPEGLTDWRQPVASGPYTLASYEPGEQIVLEARDDYYGGAPEIDTLRVDVIDDPQARMNALKSGDLDLATRVDPVIAQAEEDNPDLQILKGTEADSLALGFEMNVTKAPFDDPDVRRAMKLAIDRQALVDTVFLGEGFVGNDLVGLGLTGYNSDLPQREHDPATARRLFEAAGVEKLTVRVAEVTPGLTRASELLVQQLADVGVDLTVETADPGSYYADYDRLLSTPFQGAYYVNRDAGAYLGSFTGSHGFFNVSAFAPSGYDAALREAQGTADADTRERRFADIQKLVWEDGGTIIWGYRAVLNAGVPGLEGLYLSGGVPQLEEATVAG